MKKEKNIEQTKLEIGLTRESLKPLTMDFDYIPDSKEDIAYNLYLQGNDLYEDERYEEAADVYEAAYQIYPNKNNAHYLSNKGYCLAKLGRYEEAIEHFDRILSLNGKHEYAKESKAYALSLQGNDLCNEERYEEAVDVYEAAYQIYPNDQFKNLEEQFSNHVEAGLTGDGSYLNHL